jgi:hypothetical protein
MIKLICDKCFENVLHLNSVTDRLDVKDKWGTLVTTFTKNTYDLCNSCYEQFKRLDLDIVDFMKKPKEELDLLDGTFKIGDVVITSIGEMGHITDICDCEKCKKRGFYEPTVELTTGTGDIYITNTDKQNGFSRFYSIGTHVYGNIDEERLHNTIANTNEQLVQLIKYSRELEKQAKVLKELKNGKEE